MAHDGIQRVGFGGVLALSLLVSACASDSGDEIGTETFDAIGVDETITLGGTEPFWSMIIEGERLTYSTPENIEGETTDVARFAGNNGLGFSGELGGEALQIAVTPGQCSDGMSDRTYPFTATVELGERTLLGCGHSDSNPYTGGEGA